MLAKMIDKIVGAADIKLLTAGHQNAHHAVGAKRLDAKSGDDGAVLSTRNSKDGGAALAVLFKEIPNPGNTIVFYFQGVKHIYSPIITFLSCSIAFFARKVKIFSKKPIFFPCLIDKSRLL